MKSAGNDQRVNPFESPRQVAPPHRGQEGDWEDRRGRGPVAMFFLGGVLGVLVTAVGGAIGAGMMDGILWLAIYPRLSEIYHTPFRPYLILTPIGALLGGFMGMFPGAILGLAAGFRQARWRRRMTGWAIAMIAPIGGGVGWTGGQVLGLRYVSDMLISSIGLLCGITAGAAGGWVLAQLLSLVCWGRAPEARREASRQ